nr:hypothetical protein [Bacteroides intestinalis]
MKFFELIRRYKWDLGIAFEDEGHRYDASEWNFHIIKAPKDRWFADPFILDVTDTVIIVLVEEFSYRINRGRLAKLIIDKETFQLKSMKIVLDLNTHLSFPAILRDGTDIYIYPENSASGSSMLYKYNSEDDSVSVIRQLSNQPLTDAIITKIDDNFYIFTTEIPTQNGNKLSIYSALDDMESYKLIQNIILFDNTARSAGDIFVDNGRIVRPAQNCNGGYGVGLVFQEIIKDSKGDFVLKELFRRKPIKNYIGMHTYNQYKGCYIVDLHARRYPYLHKCLQFFKNLM